MDITPMIDITFLLLIFFIVASKIDAQPSVELAKARHGDTVAVKSSVILTLDNGSNGARVYKGDGIVAKNRLSENLEVQERQIREYIAAGLKGEAPFTSTKFDVLIKASRNLSHREVARITKAAGLSPTDEPLEIRQLYYAVLENK